MIIVPLLLGIVVLTAALHSRTGRALVPPMQRIPDELGHATDAVRSPLQQAFPHLRLWIPNEQFAHAAAHSDPAGPRSMGGTVGPDIIIGPWSQVRANRNAQTHSDAA